MIQTDKFLRYILIGILFTIGLGTLLHFTYEWSGNNPIVGLFSAVSESTWEHLKLLFFPMLIYSFLLYAKFYNVYENIPIAIAIGILSGLITIPVLFYTYTGIIGTHVLIIDLAIFVISIILAFFVSSVIVLKGCLNQKGWNQIGVALLLFLTTLFLWFTYEPPSLNLFADPSLPTLK